MGVENLPENNRSSSNHWWVREALRQAYNKAVKQRLLFIAVTFLHTLEPYH